jgi:hypothetical protein
MAITIYPNTTSYDPTAFHRDQDDEISSLDYKTYLHPLDSFLIENYEASDQKNAVRAETIREAMAITDEELLLKGYANPYDERLKTWASWPNISLETELPNVIVYDVVSSDDALFVAGKEGSTDVLYYALNISKNPNKLLWNYYHFTLQLGFNLGRMSLNPNGELIILTQPNEITTTFTNSTVYTITFDSGIRVIEHIFSSGPFEDVFAVDAQFVYDTNDTPKWIVLLRNRAHSVPSSYYDIYKQTSETTWDAFDYRQQIGATPFSLLRYSKTELLVFADHHLVRISYDGTIYDYPSWSGDAYIIKSIHVEPDSTSADNTILAIGSPATGYYGDYNKGMYVLKSVDGGLTFELVIEVVAGHYFYGLKYMGNKWAIAFGKTDIDPLIYYSFDDGYTWSSQTSMSTPWLPAIVSSWSFNRENKIMAIGSNEETGLKIRRYLTDVTPENTEGFRADILLKGYSDPHLHPKPTSVAWEQNSFNHELAGDHVYGMMTANDVLFVTSEDALNFKKLYYASRTDPVSGALEWFSLDIDGAVQSNCYAERMSPKPNTHYDEILNYNTCILNRPYDPHEVSITENQVTMIIWDWPSGTSIQTHNITKHVTAEVLADVHAIHDPASGLYRWMLLSRFLEAPGVHKGYYIWREEDYTIWNDITPTVDGFIASIVPISERSMLILSTEEVGRLEYDGTYHLRKKYDSPYPYFIKTIMLEPSKRQEENSDYHHYETLLSIANTNIEDYRHGYSLYKSVDGGISFYEVFKTKSSEPIFDIKYMGYNWVIAALGTNDHSYVYYSFDNGETWEKQNSFKDIGRYINNIAYSENLGVLAISGSGAPNQGLYRRNYTNINTKAFQSSQNAIHLNGISEITTLTELPEGSGSWGVVEDDITETKYKIHISGDKFFLSTTSLTGQQFIEWFPPVTDTATNHRYYHFLHQVVDTVTGEKAIYEIKVTIPYNTLGSGSNLNPFPIVEIINKSESYFYNFLREINVVQPVSAQCAIYFYYGDTTNLEFAFLNFNDALNHIGTADYSSTSSSPANIVDVIRVPKINRLVNSGIIKSAFFNVPDPDVVYGGYRHAHKVKADETGIFNFDIPSDYNECPYNYRSEYGLWFVGIPDANAAQTNRQIDWSLQWDNGDGSPYNTNSVTVSGGFYDLSTYANKIWKLRAYGFNDSIGAPAGGQADATTGGSYVTHNSIGGEIFYLGTHFSYR